MGEGANGPFVNTSNAMLVSISFEDFFKKRVLDKKNPFYEPK